MDDIEIKIDRRQTRRLEALFREFPRKAVRVLLTAINATLRTLRSRIVKRMSKVGGIKQKVLSDRMTIRRAGKRRLWARIQMKVGRIPIRDLGARQIKKGLSFRGVGGQRQRIPGAFLVETIARHAFKRRGEARKPIVKLYGVSFAHVWEEQDAARDDVLAEGAELFEHYLDQKFKWILSTL